MSLHPMSVHFPLTWPFLQLLVLVILLVIERQGKVVFQGWYFLAGGALLSGLVSIWTFWTGLQDADGSPLSPSLIQQHASWAKAFLGFSFLSLLFAVAIARAIQKQRPSLLLKMFMVAVSLATVLAAIFVGHFGGQLVFGGSP